MDDARLAAVLLLGGGELVVWWLWSIAGIGYTLVCVLIWCILAVGKRADGPYERDDR